MVLGESGVGFGQALESSYYRVGYLYALFESHMQRYKETNFIGLSVSLSVWRFGLGHKAGLVLGKTRGWVWASVRMVTRFVCSIKIVGLGSDFNKLRVNNFKIL